ncbi:MAG: hypothetical protein N2689_07470 [Verrucomicrobiae bacterium]|nr:hypothetical protein [Verrucomicrobiae bacterium]
MLQTRRSSPRRQDHLLARLAFGALTAMLAIPTVSAADPSPANAAAKKLYETKCLRCHEELEPAAYEETTYKRWLWRMKDKAGLDNRQYGDLSGYLKSVREAARPKKSNQGEAQR